MRTGILWISMLGSVLVGGLLEGLHLSVLFQPNSAIIVFGPIVAFLLFSVGPNQTKEMMLRLFRQAPSPQDASIMDRVSTIGFLTGGLCAVIGLIHVMGNLADASRLGAGIAVAFVGVLYGVIPALLFSALPSNSAPTVMLRKNAQSYMTASVLVLLLSFFVVLYALSNVERPKTASYKIHDNANS